AHNELTAGQVVSDTFTVTSQDGTATGTVTVTITGTNDAAVITGDASGSVTEASGVANGAAGTSPATGDLDASDVDSGTDFSVVSNGVHGTLTINAAGEWSYALNENDAAVQALNAGDPALTDTITVQTPDGTQQNIVISINGANDAAVITVNGAQDVSVTEKSGVANGTPGDAFASGDLNATDVDNPATFTVQAAVAKTYGTFSIDAAGTWSYTLDDNNATVQALNSSGANTTLHELVTVTTADGTSQVIDININGANDAAVLSSASVNLTEGNTAAAISTSGSLTISDVDSPATFVAQAATAGTYGTFAINAAGAWTYTASSAHDEFVDGQHYIENFDVVSADGTHTSVHIDILGTSDGPAAVADTIITNLAAGSAVIIPEWALIANDPASAIDVSGVGSATGGTVSQLAGSGANGTVTFADTAPMGGTFTYTATDGTSSGASALVTITQDATGTIDGTSGDNILISSNGGATLVGGAGNDVLLGGSGNDTYQFGLADGHDVISDAGSGGDSIQIVTTAPLDSTSIGTLNFERVSNDLVINVGTTEITIRDQYVGSSNNVESIQFTNGGTVYGYALSASSYRLQTTLSGGGTDDVIASTSAGQALTGGNGNDLLFGNGGDDSTINGGSGNDLVVGGTGNDTLLGAGDNDTLVGGDGNDTLTGGAGVDTLTGGIGSDIFNYGAASESTPASFDTITDFVHGTDKIDLSSIDANTASGGDQAFLFGGQNAATVANSITWSEVGGNTIIRADVNGNTSNTEFQITLTGTGLGLTASDFVL
ncbi:VCBS domain-containing protein, partial [Mesorhizobium sp. WSM3862]|uniref:VCBS domain-containing protein n=1 Tax=Mesorhizobium sp. WSM3862 TaxID=632858 RepID=UPI000BD150F3